MKPLELSAANAYYLDMKRFPALVAFLVAMAAFTWSDGLVTLGKGAAARVVDAYLALYMDSEGLRIGCL